MNYIYDIYLNLNKDLYDFFDWNKDDKITHIKKIPIYKVNESDFINLLNNKIKIDNTFLNNIMYKCELMNNKYKNIALFANSFDIIAIEFDIKGNSIKKSCLILDEELEILDIVNKMKITNVNYNIIKKEKIFLKTRKEINDKKFISDELKNINIDKLNYIYFECFGKREFNKDKILYKLNSVKENSKIYTNLYNILKLTKNK